MWLRQIETIEEREDAPPENEQNPLPKLRRQYYTDPDAETGAAHD
jgi:hypothetical protein